MRELLGDLAEIEAEHDASDADTYALKIAEAFEDAAEYEDDLHRIVSLYHAAALYRIVDYLHDISEKL